MEKMNMLQKVNIFQSEIITNIINKMKEYGVNHIMISEIGLGQSPIVIGNNDSTDQNFALDAIRLVNDVTVLFEVSNCWDDEILEPEELGIYNLAVISDYLEENKDDIINAAIPF